MGQPSRADVEALVELVRHTPADVETGLTAAEIEAAQAHFQITFPPLWQEVLRQAHPVSLPEPPRDADGVRRWTRYPDWRLRDELGTRALVDAPRDGLLFDVEHSDFWWTGWGPRPADTADRLATATARLAAAPRLVPLWGHLYVAATDDSPVFDVVQADLWIAAVTIPDLVRGRDQSQVPLAEWPIGDIVFWSELHAYAQRSGDARFSDLATGGL